MNTLNILPNLILLVRITMKFMIVFLFTLTFLLTQSLSHASFDQNHTKFTEILQKYTIQKGLQTSVDYKNLKKDKSVLESYLKDLESVSNDEFKLFSADERLSFWINVYNSYTLALIIKHYPVKSIKKIGGIFGTSPWKRSIVHVLGKKYTLNNVEHDIIRKRFKEPRIHFAVNCASVGCPSLLREAFVASKLEEQLGLASNNFLNNKSKNYVKDKTLFVSKIFDWYGDDFNEKHGSFENYVKKHYGITGKVRVKFLNYDWDLNEI